MFGGIYIFVLRNPGLTFLIYYWLSIFRILIFWFLYYLSYQKMRSESSITSFNYLILLIWHSVLNSFLLYFSFYYYHLSSIKIDLLLLSRFQYFFPILWMYRWISSKLCFLVFFRCSIPDCILTCLEFHVFIIDSTKAIWRIWIYFLVEFYYKICTCLSNFPFVTVIPPCCCAFGPYLYGNLIKKKTNSYTFPELFMKKHAEYQCLRNMHLTFL